MFIKNRSVQIIGRPKHEKYNFPTLEQMIEAEVEIMTVARELYPYVPKIIEYNREKKQLIVERIEGECLNEYIRRTNDLSILDKVQHAIKQLRAKEITLKHQGPLRYATGYLCYHDYHGYNFIVDAEKNVWFIDWDVSGLYPKEHLPDDDKEIADFIKQCS